MSIEYRVTRLYNGKIKIVLCNAKGWLIREFQNWEAFVVWRQAVKGVKL